MVLGESGVLGLLAALCFFGGTGAALWMATSHATTARRRLIALAGLFVFLEGLVRSATSSVFVAPPIAYFVLGAAALTLGLPDSAEVVDAELPALN
jgi:O-antigen ligase